MRVIQNFFESSQSRELRVTGLQARVNFESNEISLFPMSFFAMKWCPTGYKMAPDKLQNGTYYCFSKLTAGYSYVIFCESSF